MKKKRKFNLRTYSIQLRNGDWIRVKEVLPVTKKGKFRADFLGAYNFATKRIEILPPKVMYDVVLDHEASHAASFLSRIAHWFFGWKTRTLAPLAIGVGWLYFAFFNLASDPKGPPNPVILAFAFGLTLSFVILGVLGSLEEVKNRWIGREHARQIVKLWKEESG